MFTMQRTENATIVRQLIEEAWNRGNLDVCDELLAPSFVGHNAGTPDQRGIAESKQFIAAYRAGFPDLRLAIDELISEGDACVARITATGTHTGPLALAPDMPTIPPTGKRATVQVQAIQHLTNGKVSEVWSISDTLDMLKQLGVLPALAAAPVGA